jgi:multidrug efflux pump subunit AcrB
VQVTAIYPGANPKTIADTVAAPLEEAVNGVEGMIYMKSAASSDGTVADVTFKLGTDIDLAAVQVQNRVAQALPRLPEAVRQLGVTTAKVSPNMTMVVHLRLAGRRYDGLYLSNFANLRVRTSWRASTASARRWPSAPATTPCASGSTRTRRRRADSPRRHRRRDPRAERAGLGRRDRRPAAAGRRVLQLSVNAQGRLKRPEEFGDIVLKTAMGAVTRLKDVARVELGSNTYALNSLLNNQEAAAVVIFEAPGANSIALSDAVRARWPSSRPSFPRASSGT